MKRSSLAVTLGIGILTMAASHAARADVIFVLGNSPQPNEENILFNSATNTSMVTGTTNQSHVTFDFSSLTGQSLSTGGSGQAYIRTASGAPLTSMNITAPGYGFTDFIMNPFFGSGTATVVATDNLNQTFTYSLGNGQNYLTMYTINGEFITNVALRAPSGFTQFKQPRVSGVCTLVTPTSCTAVPVPEPANLALLAAGLLGLGFATRRRSV